MTTCMFKNVDVLKHVPQSLFNENILNHDGQPSEDCTEWFSTAPKFTTVRVNLLLTSVDTVSKCIKETIAEESLRRGLPAPDVLPHPLLLDCLVVPPWQNCATEMQLYRHNREVIVDAACGAAVLRGAHVFAPGIMGVLSGTEAGDLVSVYADSLGKCKRGLSVPFTDPGKLFVANGVMKMSRKTLFQHDLHPKGMAVEVTDSISGIASFSLLTGLGLLQNLPSVVCSHVLAPQPGERVIDMCAAPGHKTTHLAALMKNQGVLIALDKIPRKIESLKTLCCMMKADCVQAFAFDSTKAVSSDINFFERLPDEEWAPPYAPETFDRVLLDAPCSALGQRPQIGCSLTPKQVSSHPKLQKKLFTTAVQLVRPGGSVVYSTCSLATAENEDIVSWALKTYPELQLVPATPLLGRPGLMEENSLSEAECHKVQRFGPPIRSHPEGDTIGFFIAKFVKNTS